MTAFSMSSNQAGRTEAEGFQVSEEAFIPIVLIEYSPDYKAHDKLDMAGAPSMSQEECEQNILSSWEFAFVLAAHVRNYCTSPSTSSSMGKR